MYEYLPIIVLLAFLPLQRILAGIYFWIEESQETLKTCIEDRSGLQWQSLHKNFIFSMPPQIGSP